jgi:hypothetical protein
VATERQIAANKCNARRSTGPRSRAGKKRAGQNAYRHGLTLSSSAAFAKQIEKLARKIAGNTDNEMTLEHARDAAQATIDLARVRRVKVALIERVSALGSLETPPLFNSVREVNQFLISIGRGKMPTLPERVDQSATMSSEELERTAEAVRRALPELIKLNRYESRAAARRDIAIRIITISRRTNIDNLR